MKPKPCPNPLPHWFPKCPWPDDIWTMTEAEYIAAIPNSELRTAISGFLMRKGWELACLEIAEILDDHHETC